MVYLYKLRSAEIIITAEAHYGKQKRDSDRIIIRVPLANHANNDTNAPRVQGGVHFALPGVHFRQVGCIVQPYEYRAFRIASRYTFCSGRSTAENAS